MGYTIEELARARKLIRLDMLDGPLLERGGANFTSLSTSTIAYIFELYDTIFFQHQIRDHLARKRDLLDFDLSEVASSRAGGTLTSEEDGEQITYTITIAPREFVSLATTRSIIAHTDQKDRLGVLMLMVESLITHILMVSWGYYLASSSSYSSHGDLYRCMMGEYFGLILPPGFGHTLTSIGDVVIVGGVSPKSPSPSPSTKRPLTTGYTNWAASCYIDSILMVIFATSASEWRTGILDADVSKISYPPRGVCSPDSKIDTPDKVRNLASRVQRALASDLKMLLERDPRKELRCTVVRGLLAQCLTELKEDGSWVLYNAGSTYNAIAELFPSIKVEVPRQIMRWRGDRYVGDGVEYRDESTLQHWDFLDTYIDHEPNQDYGTIRWDLMRSPQIVFVNGGIPRIRRFSSIESEQSRVVMVGDRSGKPMVHEQLIRKARVFGEYILDDRYRLSGVVVLHGVSPTREGGSHYTCYYRVGNSDGKSLWYHFDDLRGYASKIKELPDTGVWTEARGQMPSIYFYVRVR